MILARQILTILLLLAPSAFACQICVPIPTQSAADQMIAAETVVLARENPDKPFSLLATETLKGNLTNPAIDLFLDTQSRRLLSLYPDRHIICIHDSADPDQAWRRIGITNSDVDPLLRDIIRLSPKWQNDPAARLAFFSPMLGHADPFISTISHLEIGNAPYASIRSLGTTLPREKIHAFLDNFRMAEWHALYILILAQSDHPDDQSRIRSSVESAARFSTTLQLPAWATAFIEINKEEALDFFDQQYLSNPDRSDEEIRSILAALSVHGTNGHTHLRDTIVRHYQPLADSRPQLLPTLVNDLTKWQRWDLTHEVETVLSTQADTLDLSTTLELRNYLRLAHESRSRDTAPKPDRAPIFWVVAGLLFLPIILKCLGSRSTSSR